MSDQNEFNELPEELQRLLKGQEDQEIIDFSEFRDSVDESWRNVYQSEHLPTVVMEALKSLVLLPRGDFQVPVTCSYLMLPSTLCRQVPIAFSWGLSGSGKSWLGFLAGKLHATRPISAGSSPTSLRNAINNGRCHDPELPVDAPGNEKNHVLIWEDIPPQELYRNDRVVLAFLKNGVDRSGQVSIAGMGGKIISFSVFSPKYISSITPIFSIGDFVELKRRMLVIEHKPYCLWDDGDHSKIYGDDPIKNLLDIEDVDWSGLNDEFNVFWRDKSVLRQWASISKSLRGKRPTTLDKPLWGISKDLLICGVVCGYFPDLNTGIQYIEQYWQWHAENIDSQRSAIEKVLQRFVFDKTSHIQSANQRAIESGLPSYLLAPMEISPKELKDYILECANQGELDKTPTPQTIASSMGAIGWQLSLNKESKTVWQPIVT